MYELIHDNWVMDFAAQTIDTEGRCFADRG
jgi:hypothetical protein